LCLETAKPAVAEGHKVVDVNDAVACEVGAAAVIRTRAIFGSPPVGKKAGKSFILRQLDEK
jgi:hypothetical protein